MEMAMQTIKRVGVCLLTVLMILILASCGSKELDMDALVNELTASSAFTVDMNGQDQIMPDTVIPQTYFYGAGEVVRAAMRFNGDTEEEITVFQAADSKAADHLMELCQNRIDLEKAGMQNYSPETVQRLESAILEKYGDYVVLVVANDSAAAKDIVDKYVK